MTGPTATQPLPASALLRVSVPLRVPAPAPVFPSAWTVLAAPAPLPAAVPPGSATEDVGNAPGRRDGGIPSPRSNSVSLGPLKLHAYGGLLALGGVAGVGVGALQLRAAGSPTKGVLGVLLPAVAAGVVGARAYHLVTDHERYRGKPLDAFKLWNGGLGIYGGLAAGLGVGALLAHRAKLPIAPLLDAAAVALPIAQAVGRLGNYTNQELYGRPTDLPWGLQIDPEHRPAELRDRNSFHPTFLYEAVGNVALAGGLFALSKVWKGRPTGIMLPLYAMGYGAIRFGVEGLRIDDSEQAGGLRTNQWMSLGVVAAGAIGAALIARR